ncbi:PspA/IM30 family protein [Corynebacterium lizhenjunii]|uniref:PspA/IM30 family protein n=1 Tax=Corynebacterium lizhenjunii TaxID=2709394 RepID=A0A7T0KEY2_9CORY|nr:PspA/IM30 family protein [Corynebacterium lizhenjunii]QPK79060.1 PspA/IM30 family protein [Corynebacterium lizhenjunii]
MANPVSKGWKYLMASFDQKIDDNADPKVQIQQAVAAAKKQHQEITEHAAEIIGNKSRLEMQLNRQIEAAEKYQRQTQQALQLADEASAAGDSTKAQEYTQAAEVVAAQLVAAEQELEELKVQHQAATSAAEQAAAKQKESEARLQEQLAQVDQLMAQADQAAMQESNAKAMDSLNDLNPEDSVPTLDAVRAKIEKRYADALGHQELMEGTHIQDFVQAETEIKANSRLAEIRAQMERKKELESGEDAR